MFQRCKHNGIPICAWHFLTCIEAWPDDDRKSKHVAALSKINDKDVPDIYRVIHKSLRDFRTRLRNNQDRHGRKEHINR